LRFRYFALQKPEWQIEWGLHFTKKTPPNGGVVIKIF